MLGAIAGDVIGSVFEYDNADTPFFELFSRDSTFTDDTVLTVAVADCILNGGGYAEAFKRYARAYPDRGYGGAFARWAASESMRPYNSFGNGSAMRASPVGFAFESLDEVLAEAGRSAEVTHNHPEGIKGAQATAAAVFLARTARDKDAIRREVSARFGYDLGRTVEAIRPAYAYDVTCQGSVPEAITAFLDSSDFEDCIRKAVHLGGDSDTIACIAGGIAQAFYGGVPDKIARKTRELLPDEFLDVIAAFETKFACQA